MYILKIYYFDQTYAITKFFTNQLNHFNMKRMLINYFLVLPFLFKCAAGAAHQAIIKNAKGKTLPNTQIQLRFIIKNNLQGVEVSGKPDTLLQTHFGWFQVVIGNGVPELGSYQNVDWSEANILVMECNSNGSFEEVSSQIIYGSPFSTSGDNDPSNDITKGRCLHGGREALTPILL